MQIGQTADCSRVSQSASQQRPAGTDVWQRLAVKMLAVPVPSQRMSGAFLARMLPVTVVLLASEATTTPPVMVAGAALLRIRLSVTLTFFTPITPMPMPPAVGPPPPAQMALFELATLPEA